MMRMASDGNFYLTSLNEIVRMTPDGGDLGVVHTFEGYEGYDPQGFIQASDGYIYGTAVGGSYGTLFRMTLDGSVTVLHAFSNPDPSNPRAAPIQADDGRVYGTTLYGGSGNGGVVFRFTLPEAMPKNRM
jgi:uncharacterized repeat protein (TIGR03803 family)